MRRLIVGLLTVAITAIPATSAFAATATPQVLGRKLVLYGHNSNPEEGAVECSAQGMFVDTNGNGIRESIQARAACKEVHSVIAVRIYDNALQRWVGGAWQTAIYDPTDAYSGSEPAYAVTYTDPFRICTSNPSLMRTYRTIHHDAIRWSNNVVGYRTTTSFNFTARALYNDPACPPA